MEAILGKSMPIGKRCKEVADLFVVLGIRKETLKDGNGTLTRA